MVSERVRRQIAERQRAMAAAEAAPEMSGRAAAELKRALAELLLPGETVTAALRRLRPAPARPAGRRGAFCVYVFGSQSFVLHTTYLSMVY